MTMKEIVMKEIVWGFTAFALLTGMAGQKFRRLSVSDYRDRVKAGWLGQIAGVSWGAPTEFQHCYHVIPEDKVGAWRPQMINEGFWQDDLYVEMTFLRTLETKGFDVPIREAGIDFANSKFALWHANVLGRDNLRRGIAPPACSHPKHNPCANDIDYQIEADYSGLIAPGCPSVTIALGEKFGRLMNYGDGLWAGQFVGALYGEAFFETNRVKIVEAALKCIPSRSRYAEMARDMLAWYAADQAEKAGGGGDWKGAWKKLVDKYGHDEGCQAQRCVIEATLNGGVALLGLLWGGGDPNETIKIAMRGGFDSDCNPSTAAGVLFTSIGAKSLPDRFKSSLNETQKFAHTEYAFPDLVDVCEKLAREAVVRAGGRVVETAEGDVFEIPVRPPEPSAFHPFVHPGPCEETRYTSEERDRILYSPTTSPDEPFVGWGAESVPPAEKLFANPPDAAKPQTWWHWMNGNVTKEGVTADLEAMARIGLGGAHLFDAGCGIPAGPVAFDTPAWYDMLKYACSEAKRLGLALTLSNCSGWSSSGGPWVKPADAMKYIYISTTNVTGGAALAYPLPKPIADDHGFYEDIATIAFPMPADDVKIPNWKDQTFQRRVPMKVAEMFYRNDRTEPGPGGTVKREEIVTLSGPWTAPAGKDWIVLRIGYACNGQRNHPASFNGCGLEVDKLASGSVARHFDAYAGRLLRELGVTPGHNDSAFRGLLVDSYETDCQTWTQGFEKTFASRQGYDLAPFLPTLAGYVVDDLKTTEEFLLDYRRTLADLFAENYGGTLRKKCDEYGLDLYLEAYGNGPFEFLQYGSRASIPMGEFWFETDDYPDSARTAWGWWCINGMCSPIAHVHGKKIVAAESFSAAAWNGRWKRGPFEWKATGDKAYCDGVTRIVYHRFAHQPWTNVWPGMTMGCFGSQFDRTLTWWDQGAEWIKYQTRCQALLQYGDHVADVLYFRSEDPLDDNMFFTEPLGFGWKHDTICREDFLKLLVEKGRVFLPGGTRYARFTAPVNASAPVREKLAWIKQLGGVELAPDKSNLPPPDFECPPGTHPKLSWEHRAWPDGSSSYFVAYGHKEPTEIECSFRQQGKKVEFWHPDTGTIERAAKVREENGRTFVKIPFDPCGSVFVVFRDHWARSADAESSPRQNKDDSSSLRRDEAVASTIAVAGPWKVTFVQRVTNGEPEVKTVEMPELKDWTTFDDPFVRYFSGTAAYEATIPVAPARRRGPHDRALLDLGAVKNLADVTVNGKTYPTLWKPPFVLDITDVLSTSTSNLNLRIRLTNYWANRLIGDEQLPADCEYEPDDHANDKDWPGHAVKALPSWLTEGKRSPTGRYTFSTWRHFRKGDKPLPSGLFGPVKLLMRQ